MSLRRITSRLFSSRRRSRRNLNNNAEDAANATVPGAASEADSGQVTGLGQLVPVHPVSSNSAQIHRNSPDPPGGGLATVNEDAPAPGAQAQTIEELTERITFLQGMTSFYERKLQARTRDHHASIQHYLARIEQSIIERDEVNNLLTDLLQHTSLPIRLDISLRNRLSRRETRIRELMDNLTRLSDQRPALESRMDDLFFQRELELVFKMVEKWVYESYGKLEITMQVLEGVRKGREEVFVHYCGMDWADAMLEDRLAVIGAVVNRAMVERVMGMSLLGVEDVQDTSLLRIPIEDAYTSGKDEDVAWRMSTISRITSTSVFLHCFKGKISDLAREIVGWLAPLSPPGTKGGERIQRTHDLNSIIEQAGKLAIEAWKEPSRYDYVWFGKNDEVYDEITAQYTSILDTPHMKNRGVGVDMERDDASSSRTILAPLTDRQREYFGRRLGYMVSPAVVKVDYHTKDKVILLKGKAKLALDI